MPQLVPTDLSRTAGFLADVGGARSIDEFASRCVTGIRTLLPSDYASFNEVDLAQRRALFITDPPEVMFAELFAAHMDEHPLVRHYGGDGRGALPPSDSFGLSAFEHTGLYTTMLRGAAVEHILALALESRDGEPLIVLAMHRGALEFTVDEFALLESLHPHLVRAYRTAEERELLDQVNALLGGEGREVLTVGPDATVRHASAGAAGLLARHLPSSASPTDQPLPRHVIASLAAAEVAGPPVAVTQDGGLTATVLSRSAMRTTVLLEESQNGAAVTALSARESEVLERIAAGMTNRQVAEELGISAWTVKSHVGHIYEKLGVRTRAAAVAARYAH